MSTQPVSITLDKELLAQIDRLAKESDRPRSWFFNQAVSGYLQDLREADEALKRLNDPGDALLTEQQVRTALGL